MTQLHELFARAVTKRRRANQIAAVVMFFLAVGGAIWGFSEPADRAMAKMAVLSSVAMVVALLIFGLTFLKHRGLEALQTPQQIVWFYGISQGPHVTGVMIGTELGKLHKLPVPSLEESGLALSLLREAAASATEGFTEQHRVCFRKEPRALRIARTATNQG